MSNFVITAEVFIDCSRFLCRHTAQQNAVQAVGTYVTSLFPGLMLQGILLRIPILVLMGQPVNGNRYKSNNQQAEDAGNKTRFMINST